MIGAMSQPASSPGPGQSLLLWAARSEQPGVIRLICDEAADRVRSEPDETVVAWRGCLTELPRALPFELLSAGVERVILDVGDCGGEWRAEFAELALVAGVGDRIQLQTEPSADAKRPKRVLDADAMPVLRRRSIFGLGATGAGDEPELPDRTGSPQQRLRAIIREFATEIEPPDAPEDGWTTGAIEIISDGCVAAGVCVKACPTDALALESAGGRAGLGFDPSLCTGCGRCLAVCDAKALSSKGRLGPPALLTKPVLLELFDVTNCARCKTPFRGEGQYCPVCAFRVANPFGSTLPPGFARD